MPKEHIRRHVADLRGHFTLLLLPPLFRKQDTFSQVQNQQLLTYFTSSLRKTPLQTWNSFFLHPAKKDSFEDQHLLLLHRLPLLLLHVQEPPPSSPGRHL